MRPRAGLRPPNNEPARELHAARRSARLATIHSQNAPRKRSARPQYTPLSLPRLLTIRYIFHMAIYHKKYQQLKIRLTLNGFKPRFDLIGYFTSKYPDIAISFLFSQHDNHDNNQLECNLDAQMHMVPPTKQCMNFVSVLFTTHNTDKFRVVAVR